MTTPRKLLYVSAGGCPTRLEQQLQQCNWEVVATRSLKSARQLLLQHRFQVGLLMLDSIQPETVTEFGHCAMTVASCEWVGVFPRGALANPGLRDMVLGHFFDHHTQPADPLFLCQSVGHAYGRAMLRAVDGEPAESLEDMGMIGRSEAIAYLRRMIRKAAPTDAPVLIGGESGSGKELVAKALHIASPRADAPFVAVNLGALAPTLIHSELFGHERGAFSGAATERRGLIETARGGTLFLDEIAELPMDLQATLLRFLQEKTIHRVGGARPLTADTRVVAASHVDLAQAVATGRFREDLYYRLNVLPLVVPALRERREDIPALAHHFYDRFAREHHRDVKGFSRPAMTALMLHSWPGNVRELCNRVQRACVMAEQRTIAPLDLGLTSLADDSADTLLAVRQHAEKSAINLSLDRAGHNVTLAARELGVSRMTLYRLMARHSIAPRMV